MTVMSCSVFDTKLRDCCVGNQIIYFTGHLGEMKGEEQKLKEDRRIENKALREKLQRELDVIHTFATDLSEHVMKLHKLGQIYLFQKRHNKNSFDYIAVKR